jgi:hypothetical protein
MRRRIVLVTVMAFALFLVGTGTALAWDLIADKTGIGSTTLRAWTRNYNQVAFVADHPGTRIDVAVTVSCNNGDHFDNTWVDGGTRFRFVLSGMNNSGRCNHTLKVVPRDSSETVYLSVYARG